MSSSNVISLAAYRARREGWQPVEGVVETKVFQAGEDVFELRLDDGEDEDSYRVNRSWLEQFHAKIGRVLAETEMPVAMSEETPDGW